MVVLAGAAGVSGPLEWWSAGVVAVIDAERRCVSINDSLSTQDMLEWLVVKIDELLAISVRIAAALEGLADETRQQRLLFAETDLSVKRVVAAVRGLVDRRQGQEPRIRPGLGANAEVDALIEDWICGGERPHQSQWSAIIRS